MPKLSEKFVNLIESLQNPVDDLMKFGQINSGIKWLEFKISALRLINQLPSVNNADRTWKTFADYGFQVNSEYLSHKNDVQFTNEENNHYFSKIIVGPDGLVIDDAPGLKKTGVVITNLLKGFEHLEEELINSISSGLTDRLSALTAGIAQYGLLIYVPDGLCIEKPLLINITSYSSGIFPVHLITNLGKRSSLKIILTLDNHIESKNDFFLPLLNTILLEDESELQYTEIQRLGNNCTYLPSENVISGRESRYSRMVIDKGSKSLRRTFRALLNGELSEAKVSGIYEPKKDQVYIFDTYQKHNANHTTSYLHFKGVLNENAHVVWKGNVGVRVGVKGADGYQLNNNLVMSDQAKIETVPGLEISNDDVKCSHGVTISNVDPDQLFYLKSRGIDDTEGRQLIVKGFLNSELESIRNVLLKDAIFRELGLESQTI